MALSSEGNESSVADREYQGRNNLQVSSEELHRTANIDYSVDRSSPLPSSEVPEAQRIKQLEHSAAEREQDALQ